MRFFALCRYAGLCGGCSSSSGGRLAKPGPRGLGHRHPRGGGNETVLWLSRGFVFFPVCLLFLFASIKYKPNLLFFPTLSIYPLGGARFVQFENSAPSFFQAVSRISERDGVTTEDALRRLQSQWSNSKQIEHANVVLSTLWEPEVTQKQVKHTLCHQHRVRMSALHGKHILYKF